MADTNWPVQLNAVAARLGWTRRPQSAVARSETDHGPREVRLEFTAVAVSYTVTYRYTQAEADIFWSWFEDVINGAAFGSRTFSWTDPQDDVLDGATARFLSEPVAANINISGDGTGGSAGSIHDIRCEIEVLP